MEAMVTALALPIGYATKYVDIQFIMSTTLTLQKKLTTTEVLVRRTKNNKDTDNFLVTVGDEPVANTQN
jgi:hypothetical protein